jgi:outer membrane protein assembly factor BamB
VLWYLDLATGKTLWKAEFPLRVDSRSSTAWSTSDDDGELVFARSGDGEVRYLAAKDGMEQWSWSKDKKLLAEQDVGELYVYTGGLPPNSRMAIWGDSITELTLHPQFVEMYLLALAGRKDVKVCMFGHSGERVGGPSAGGSA